ncbi:MAG: tetratricopeptide repeat protein [Gammaproteobacteria bacterium]
MGKHKNRKGKKVNESSNGESSLGSGASSSSGSSSRAVGTSSSGSLEKAVEPCHQTGVIANIPLAITLYKEAIRFNPNCIEALFCLGDILSLSDKPGELEEARVCYQRVVDIQPDNWKAHFKLACILEKLGKGVVAIAHFETVTVLNPKCSLAYSNLGALLINLGRATEAISRLQKAIELCSEDANAHYYYAKALYIKAREDNLNELEMILLDQKEIHPHLQRAKFLYEEALKNNSQDPLVHNNYGEVLRALGKQKAKEVESATRVSTSRASSSVSSSSTTTNPPAKVPSTIPNSTSSCSSPSSVPKSSSASQKLGCDLHSRGSSSTSSSSSTTTTTASSVAEDHPAPYPYLVFHDDSESSSVPTLFGQKPKPSSHARRAKGKSGSSTTTSQVAQVSSTM